MWLQVWMRAKRPWVHKKQRAARKAQLVVSAYEKERREDETTGKEEPPMDDTWFDAAASSTGARLGLPRPVSCMGEDALLAEMNEQVIVASDFFNISHEHARQLLNLDAVRWDYQSLQEHLANDSVLFDHIAAVADLDAALSALGDDFADMVATCPICVSEVSKADLLECSAGHAGCVGCWRAHLCAVAQRKGNLACLAPGCNCTPLERRTLSERLEPLECVLAKCMRRGRLHRMVEVRQGTPCGNGSCDQVIFLQPHASRPLAWLYPLACKCGYEVCAGCGNAAHVPLPCNLDACWRKKQDKASSWEILSRTKHCPVCKVRIEKNGGCPHMSCARCKNQFCWQCGWSCAESETFAHACSSSGDWIDAPPPAMSTAEDEEFKVAYALFERLSARSNDAMRSIFRAKQQTKEYRQTTWSEWDEREPYEDALRISSRAFRYCAYATIALSFCVHRPTAAMIQFSISSIQTLADQLVDFVRNSDIPVSVDAVRKIVSKTRCIENHIEALCGMVAAAYENEHKNWPQPKPNIKVLLKKLSLRKKAATNAFEINSE